MHDWITITTVFGSSIREPSEIDMQVTLQELFSEADDEHFDAYMECCSENGPLHCILIFSSGYALYKKYSDADMTQELATKKISPVNQNAALVLWKKLAAGLTEEI